MCVLWKQANLPGWLHWPQAIDYTPSRLECHWDTGSDQILLQPNLSPPFLSVWKMASNCCCTSQNVNGPGLCWIRTEWDSFPVSFFLSWYAETVFSSLVTVQLLEQKESCCWDILFSLFYVHFIAVLTAGEELSTVKPHCTQSFIFSPFFSLIRSVEAKELEAMRIEEKNAFNLDFIS